MTRITSTSNPLVKRVRRLRHKKHRLREGAFFIEGLRVVLTALEQDAPVEVLIWCDALLQSKAGRRAVDGRAARGEACAEVSETVFRAVADRDTPAGLAAIVHTRATPLEALPIRPNSVFVTLVDVADPGNLGTIIRTVDALDADGVILCGDTTDPYHPTAVKATMGALFAVPVTAPVARDNLIAWARQHGLSIAATSAHVSTPAWTAQLDPPLLLLMGSERHGLSAEWLQVADQRVTIPMRGVSSSLNLAIATSLLLYEIRRPR